MLGEVVVTEQTLIALGIGMKRMNVPLAGVTLADKLVFAAKTGATAGCEAVNVYPAAAGQVTVAYFTPALGLAQRYTIPIDVYKIT